MFKTGLVSVTFRQKTIEEILALMNKCGLTSLEIGSDVHAPREETHECRRIAELCRERGIEIVSYGSYYRLGEAGNSAELFAEYLAAARLLGAKNIRIWAGVKGSKSASEEERAAWTAEARACAEAAEKGGITLSFEYHGGTLTDTEESALRLMRELSHPNAYLYWQPNQYQDTEYNCRALQRVLPYVKSIHVFSWDARSGECVRYPLAAHAEAWKQYFSIFAADRRSRELLLEFVKDDLPEQLLEDAATLEQWRKEYAV